MTGSVIKKKSYCPLFLNDDDRTAALPFVLFFSPFFQSSNQYVSSRDDLKTEKLKSRFILLSSFVGITIFYNFE